MARYLFLLAKTKDRKFKQKLKGKTYLTLRRRRPTQPSRPRGARGSSSPSRASKLLGGMPPSEPRTTRRCRRALATSCFPLATSSRLETPRWPPHPFHPPWTSSPSPLREFVDVRKLTGAHHRRNRGHLPPQPLPPCPEHAPTSSSSLGASNRSQEPRARRHLHQLLAGAAARFRRIHRR